MPPREKIIRSLAQLHVLCNNLKESRKKIVLTSGCFDLVHGGHLEYVYQASQYGFLVVGINSDEFVKRLKGEGRPIRDEVDRAFVMAGFEPVGFVTIFNQDDDLIRAVEPDVYVASTTSHVKIFDDVERVHLLNWMGAQIVELGAQSRTNSTTNIIEKIKS